MESKEIITLKLKAPVSLINAVRRSVDYIPLLAIDSLEITKNDSALYDEMIAHRVGLVPLKNENLVLAEECNCKKEEGCGKCSVKFKLSSKGPGTVYSTDLNPKTGIVCKIPLVILDKEQELEFVATAKMGRGINHAKFSPGIIYYRYSEDLENKDDEKFKKMVEDAEKDEKKELEIVIESWGQISPKEIFEKAISQIQNELCSLKDFLK
jgi:DNA-directed RNA polymerase subunit D